MGAPATDVAGLEVQIDALRLQMHAAAAPEVEDYATALQLKQELEPLRSRLVTLKAETVAPPQAAASAPSAAAASSAAAPPSTCA